MAEEGEQEEELEEEEAGEESERARLPYSISPKAGSLSNTKDMGSQAIWTLSSAKPGSGVDRLRDEDLNVYWQSEGAAPHLIDVQFLKKVTISEVSIYLDYPNDESYTPKTLSIRCGTNQQEMTEVLRVEVDQPMGWINCPLSIISADGDLQPFRAYFMQIRVLTMHQNGRDTHIRGCKVFGPCYPMHIDKTLPPFTSDEFTHLSTIR